VITLALLSSVAPSALFAQAQEPATTGQAAERQTVLPPITVQRAQPRRATVSRAPAPRSEAAPQQPQQPQSNVPQPVTAGGATTIGYIETRTATATKTETPLIDIPQSISVLTKEFIQDQGFQSMGESLRYVPGVIPHQGEGNRDDVVIRGQRSNADFFVNGIRDDVQYFRDFYNLQTIEVLKGPNAMIFGRGGGGGIINRILKEADGRTVREVVLQGGQFDNKRAAIDVGGAVNPNVAVRFNAVYENSGSYRDYVNLERYGFNPTMTLKPTENTTWKLSYEYFHDWRVADRGIPSQAGPLPPAKLRPFATDVSTFFGNPDLNHAQVDANIATSVLEHDFGGGLKVKNSTRYASYDKFYQNIYPGSAVNAAQTSFNLTAYNNQTDRDNLFNQTDFVHKATWGPLRNTLMFGAEFGRQSGLSFRQNGFFATNNSNNLPTNPFFPVSFVPVNFRYVPGQANSTYNLDLAAAYAQDQLEITKYVQLIGGARFDRFDYSSQDRGTLAINTRIDNLVSPRAGVVLKPVDNLAFYGSYSVSYLPSSGDQFSTLSPGTAIAKPEEFINKEVGMKWDINPLLQFTTAYYYLIRKNQRLPDPTNSGFFILSGRTDTQGFEAGLTGYVTDKWQISGGYAYTDARIVGATSATILPGNRIGLVPYNTFTLWNKYQFTEWFGAGVGVIRYTDFYASSDDTVLLDGFTRVDAGLYGKFSPSVKWQLNVENVFDKKYYSTADGNNNITPGGPRTFRGTLIATF
jgi:catecholate siderophore receptor